MTPEPMWFPYGSGAASPDVDSKQMLGRGLSRGA